MHGEGTVVGHAGVELVPLREGLAVNLFVPPFTGRRALPPGVQEGVLDPRDPGGVLGAECRIVEVGLVGLMVIGAGRRLLGVRRAVGLLRSRVLRLGGLLGTGLLFRPSLRVLCRPFGRGRLVLARPFRGGLLLGGCVLSAWALRGVRLLLDRPLVLGSLPACGRLLRRARLLAGRFRRPFVRHCLLGRLFGTRRIPPCRPFRDGRLLGWGCVELGCGHPVLGWPLVLGSLPARGRLLRRALLLAGRFRRPFVRHCLFSRLLGNRRIPPARPLVLGSLPALGRLLRRARLLAGWFCRPFVRHCLLSRLFSTRCIPPDRPFRGGRLLGWGCAELGWPLVRGSLPACGRLLRRARLLAGRPPASR
ncbi:hypothetical protein AB0M71_27790 [Amycolatopsis sp. NPDC051114]|uniref:hypothetical protein n=1 Tax=Amycolatopsis sp. NPDC051114 TaxID=3155280 RepID=UPI00342DC3CB